jgi:hypothetical protein
MLSIICQEIHSKVTTCSVPMLHMENPHPSQKGAKDGGLDFLKRERHVCAFCLYRAVPAYYCPHLAQPLISIIR